MPLAVATPDLLGAIRLNWVHGNHLGVPLVTTDSGGNPATTPNDYLAPGFPGQSRVLPDLYYNRHRDYDPATGRYIQADPIGLAGGSNPYLYAEGNPVNVVDSEGLQAVAAVGGALGIDAAVPDPTDLALPKYVRADRNGMRRLSTSLSRKMHALGSGSVWMKLFSAVVKRVGEKWLSS
jgi:RHS repeat-associated protein